MGHAKPFALGGQELALEILLARVGDGMHERVEAAEVALDTGEDRGDLGVGADIARIEHRARQGRGQLLDVFLEALALVGEGQPHAGPGQRLRDGPRDRAFVGDTEDDAGFAVEHGP